MLFFTLLGLGCALRLSIPLDLVEDLEDAEFIQLTASIMAEPLDDLNDLCRFVVSLGEYEGNLYLPDFTLERVHPSNECLLVSSVFQDDNSDILKIFGGFVKFDIAMLERTGLEPRSESKLALLDSEYICYDLRLLWLAQLYQMGVDGMDWFTLLQTHLEKSRKANVNDQRLALVQEIGKRQGIMDSNLLAIWLACYDLRNASASDLNELMRTLLAKPNLLVSALWNHGLVAGPTKVAFIWKYPKDYAFNLLWNVPIALGARPWQFLPFWLDKPEMKNFEQAAEHLKRGVIEVLAGGKTVPASLKTAHAKVIAMLDWSPLFRDATDLGLLRVANVEAFRSTPWEFELLRRAEQVLEGAREANYELDCALMLLNSSDLVLDYIRMGLEKRSQSVGLWDLIAHVFEKQKEELTILIQEKNFDSLEAPINHLLECLDLDHLEMLKLLHGKTPFTRKQIEQIWYEAGKDLAYDETQSQVILAKIIPFNDGPDSLSSLLGCYIKGYYKEKGKLRSDPDHEFVGVLYRDPRFH